MTSVLIVGLVVAFMTSLQRTSGFILSGHWGCESVSEYKALRSEISRNPCISATQIWPLLEPVVKNHRHCLNTLFSAIAADIDSSKDPAGQCQCTGDFQKNDFNLFGSKHNYYFECLRNNPSCKYLYDYFYLHLHHHDERSDCKTHHHVWNHLRDIHNGIGDLQGDFVLHLTSTFSNGLENTCKCTEKAPLELTTASTASAQVSETPLFKMTSLTTTDLPASATSLKYQMTTTTAVTTCDKFGVLIALAKDSPVVNQNATECLTGSHSSHDALVLSQCNVSSSPSSWKQGINVMSDCVGAKSLHAYTPVAMFQSGMYPSTGSISGIFLHCTTTGFSLVSQSCDQPPHVIDIDGTNNYDPNLFYTIS